MKFLGAIKHLIKLKISDKLASGTDLPSHTIEQNQFLWENYDWSKRGEEWTGNVKNPEQWKNALLQNLMFKYIKNDSNILEVGPGAGRWTKYLQPLSKQLTLVDITPKCIEMCKQRFKDKDNINYNLVSDTDLSFIPDNSIDSVWSYDVFVHVNPSDTERYIKQFARIMKKDGNAIIHHAGTYDDPKIAKRGFRSLLNADIMKEMVVKNGFTLIAQDIHKLGDIITIFRK